MSDGNPIPNAETVLQDFAKHLGLALKIVGNLADDIHGVLLPDEQTILINASKPRDEQIFTALHEMGHYVIHVQQRHRHYHSRILDLPWKHESMERVCSKIRRHIRFGFGRQQGREWMADLWAMGAFTTGREDPRRETGFEGLSGPSPRETPSLRVSCRWRDRRKCSEKDSMLSETLRGNLVVRA